MQFTMIITGLDRPETVTPKPTSHNQRLLINIESEDRLGSINDICLTLHNLGANINKAL